jgi:CTP synthase (UTP-ammonia lyase)
MNGIRTSRPPRRITSRQEQIYDSVISKKGEETIWGTVQVIPHITDEIKAKVLDLGKMSTS